MTDSEALAVIDDLQRKINPILRGAPMHLASVALTTLLTMMLVEMSKVEGLCLREAEQKACAYFAQAMRAALMEDATRGAHETAH